MNITCETCVFYERVGKVVGLCRRHGPRRMEADLILPQDSEEGAAGWWHENELRDVGMEVRTGAVWPWVRRDDWCGEWDGGRGGSGVVARCSTCRFWVKRAGGASGDCRRAAPACVLERSHAADDRVAECSFAQPVTPAGHWCGEWQPKPRRGGR